MDWAKSRDPDVKQYADLANSEIVNRMIEGEVAKANNRLARAEQIKAFRILPEELSPEKRRDDADAQEAPQAAHAALPSVDRHAL